MYGIRLDAAMIMFRAHNRIVRFVIPLPSKSNKDIKQTPKGRARSSSMVTQEYEKELRRRWRALVLSIKGKLEAVETGIMTFEEEFMANIVLPNDQTVSDFMIPQIAQAYNNGNMPKMLPFFEK